MPPLLPLLFQGKVPENTILYTPKKREEKWKKNVSQSMT